MAFNYEYSAVCKIVLVMLLRVLFRAVIFFLEHRQIRECLTKNILANHKLFLRQLLSKNIFLAEQRGAFELPKTFEKGLLSTKNFFN